MCMTLMNCAQKSASMGEIKHLGWMQCSIRLVARVTALGSEQTV